MELVDYTGKLNSHNEYLQIINQLENKCKYIEYVLVNQDEIKFVEKFENLIVSLEQILSKSPIRLSPLYIVIYLSKSSLIII